MNYSYIIVEDEQQNIDILKGCLQSFPDLLCRGTAGTVSEGLKLILRERPSIVFLDVELGDESGFDLLSSLQAIPTEFPYIVLLSELEKYARQAINGNVCYFLDKPLNEIQLSLAIHKFKKHFAQRQRFLTIKDKSGHWFVHHHNILYIQADSNYSYIHRITNRRITVTKTMKDIEAMLPETFMRVHKSYIINTNYIEKINTTLKSIILNVRMGIFDISPAINKSDEQFPFKEIVMDVPIGEMYLEKVKNSLLTAKSS